MMKIARKKFFPGYISKGFCLPYLSFEEAFLTEAVSWDFWQQEGRVTFFWSTSLHFEVPLSGQFFTSLHLAVPLSGHLSCKGLKAYIEPAVKNITAVTNPKTFLFICIYIDCPTPAWLNCSLVIPPSAISSFSPFTITVGSTVTLYCFNLSV